MKRILYEKLNEFQFISKDPIKIKDGKAVAIYDTSNKTFKILDNSTNEVLATGSGTSMSKILIKIKEALKSLGAKFELERRYRDHLKDIKE